MDLFSLHGRTVIVTGASSGIGARFAAVLHGAGAQVVVAARRVDRLTDLAAELPGIVVTACDVAVEEDRVRLIEGTVERFGRVDVLVNNAGTSDTVRIEEETLANFERVLGVNLVGAWRLAQLAGLSMLDNGGGVIVNVASILGMVASGQIPQSSYVASKSALIGLTRELGAQWARKGVRVNALAPGWFPSEMTADMFEGEQTGLGWVRNRTPMGRPGMAHELDGALLFLASDASSYMTGHTLAIDGGWTIV